VVTSLSFTNPIEALAMKTPPGADFTGQDIYAGIDMHRRTWQVSIYTRHGHFQSFSQEADPERLLRYFRRTFPGAHVHAAYEAGFSGFWLAHRLQADGVEVSVVHPADVPTTDKERCYKRNVRDARKLGRNLWTGQLTPLYIPSAEQAADRALVRSRYRLVGKQTRVKNQIKSHLHFFGVRLPEEMAGRCWSARFIGWLEQLVPQMTPRGAAETLHYYLEELHHLRRLILVNTRSIRTLSCTERYRTDTRHLLGLHGVGLVGAMTLQTEIIEIDRFGSLDRLSGFVGLAPTLRGSGDHEYEGALTPRRSKHLRRILVESAWVAVRKDPRLMADFEHLCRRMPKNRAIIRIARKQLNRVRFVLKNKRPYITMPLAHTA